MTYNPYEPPMARSPAARPALSPFVEAFLFGLIVALGFWLAWSVPAAVIAGTLVTLTRIGGELPAGREDDGGVGRTLLAIVDYDGFWRPLLVLRPGKESRMDTWRAVVLSAALGSMLISVGWLACTLSPEFTVVSTARGVILAVTLEATVLRSVTPAWNRRAERHRAAKSSAPAAAV
jgi:hypothetical protein